MPSSEYFKNWREKINSFQTEKQVGLNNNFSISLVIGGLFLVAVGSVMALVIKHRKR